MDLRRDASFGECVRTLQGNMNVDLSSTGQVSSFTAQTLASPRALHTLTSERTPTHSEATVAALKGELKEQMRREDRIHEWSSALCT